MLEKIVIAGHRVQTMQRLLSLNPKEFEVLVINNPGEALPAASILEQCAINWSNIQFHDVAYPFGQYVAPQEDHIHQMLDWSVGRKNIMVACHAGMSRSSATAYLIACREWGVDKAIEILDPALHYPNRRIVSFGAKILNDSKIWDKYKSWMNKEVGEDVQLI